MPATVRTIGIDTGKNTLHMIGWMRRVQSFCGKGRSRPDRRTTCKRAAMPDRHRSRHGNASRHSFDHLVGACKQRRPHLEPSQKR